MPDAVQFSFSFACTIGLQVTAVDISENMLVQVRTMQQNTMYLYTQSTQRFLG